MQSIPDAERPYLGSHALRLQSCRLSILIHGLHHR
jgi:hypothetical protein